MNLTDTFPPNVLPVRSGVYMTQNIDPEDSLPVGDWSFSYFEAYYRLWGCANRYPQTAANRPDYDFAWQTKQWRGVSGQSN